MRRKNDLPEQFFAIYENGSGKSTILNIIAQKLNVEGCEQYTYGQGYIDRFVQESIFDFGAFAIGAIVALATKYCVSDSRVVLLLKTGICDGFTTFSTFALETTELVQNGHSGMAAVYVFLSIILGTLAVWAALRIF